MQLCRQSRPLKNNSQGHLHFVIPPALYALETANAYLLQQADPGDVVEYNGVNPGGMSMNNSEIMSTSIRKNLGTKKTLMPPSSNVSCI